MGNNVKFDEKAFGKRIKCLRELENFSKSEVAEKLGLSEKEYLSLENGESHDVDIKISYTLCLLYEVPADYLLGILEDILEQEIDLSNRSNYSFLKLLHTTGALRSEDKDVLNKIRNILIDQLQYKENVPTGVSLEKSTPIKFDKFEPSSHNGFMIGTKSASKNYICEECGAFLGSSARVYSLHMRQAHGIKTIIVDEGGEYEKLAREFGGEVIKLNPESAKSINVFDLMSEDVENVNSNFSEVKNGK